jgi:hypothetical protein
MGAPRGSSAPSGTYRGAPNRTYGGSTYRGGTYYGGRYYGGSRYYGSAYYGHSFYYPRYAPYGHYYAPYYYPGFSFGFYFGYPYSYGYPYYGYPYYGYPYAAPYYGYAAPYAQAPAPNGYVTSGGGDQPPPAPRGVGEVRIEGAPKDAQVYADGQLVGSVGDFDGPVRHLPLEAGPHTIEVRMAGMPPVTYDVDVRAGQTMSLHANVH